MLETLRAQTQTDVEAPSKSKNNEPLPEVVELHLTARCQEDIEVAKKRIDDLIKRQEEEFNTKETLKKEPIEFKVKKEVKRKSDQTTDKDKNYMKNIVTPIINQEKPQPAQMRERNVRIPKDKHGLIIGKGGQNIERIKATYGVSITVPPADDPKDIITLKGTSKEALEEAKYEILQFLQDGRGAGRGRGGGGRSQGGGSKFNRFGSRDQSEKETKIEKSKSVPKPPQKINLNDANEWPAFG